jgi:hypothetical protein
VTCFYSESPLKGKKSPPWLRELVRLQCQGVDLVMVNAHYPSGMRQDESDACCNNDASCKICGNMSSGRAMHTDYERMMRCLTDAILAWYANGDARRTFTAIRSHISRKLEFHV